MKKQPLEIVIGKDNFKIEEIIEGSKVGQGLLQNVVDEFKKCAFYDPEAELPTITQNLESLRKSYIQHLVMEMHPVPEGSVLELDVEHESGRYKLPTPQLDRAIAEANQAGINLTFFELKNGKVKIRHEAVQRATDRYRTVIKSKQGLRFLELSQKIMVELKELDSLARPTGTILLNRLHPVQLDRFWKETDDGYAIHPQFMRRIEKYWARIEEEEGQ